MHLSTFDTLLSYKGKEVAVKVLKTITTQSQLEEFKKEFQIMCAIRSPFMVLTFLLITCNVIYLFS